MTEKGFGDFVEKLLEFSGREMQFKGQTLKLGEVVFLRSDGTPAIKVKVDDRKIDLNLQGKNLMMDLFKAEVEPENKSTGGVQSLKDMADRLKKDGFTVCISYEGQILLKLGAEAKPSPLLRLATRSGAIEMHIGELVKLIQENK